MATFFVLSRLVRRLPDWCWLSSRLPGCGALAHRLRLAGFSESNELGNLAENAGVYAPWFAPVRAAGAPPGGLRREPTGTLFCTHWPQGPPRGTGAAAQPRRVYPDVYPCDRWRSGAASICNHLVCRFSSAVEQRFCKPKVGSSILSTGTSQINDLSPALTL